MSPRFARVPRKASTPIGALALSLAALAFAQASFASTTLAAVQAPGAAAAERASALQAVLDRELERCGAPGATFGAALADGTSLALASGFSDREVAMRPHDRMLAGSVGKTFFAALALALVAEGKLALDQPIALHLGDRPWFDRLPNARSITVEQLMNHTSGLVRYELREDFTRDLRASPDRRWTPDELVGYLLDSKAPFDAGKGWDYSDTNYIVLGTILERVGGKPAYDAIRARFLEPLELPHAIPSTSRRIEGLVRGHVADDDPFGPKAAEIVDGALTVNPQFEWAGGGFATCAHDLARWARALYGGDSVAGELARDASRAVDAAMLGPGVRYGLGVIARDTELGPTLGHRGYFPGYQAEMLYFVDHDLAVAIQINSSDRARLGRGTGAMLIELARAAIASAK